MSPRHARAEGGEQLAVGSWQLAVGSRPDPSAIGRPLGAPASCRPRVTRQPSWTAQRARRSTPRGGGVPPPTRTGAVPAPAAHAPSIVARGSPRACVTATVPGAVPPATSPAMERTRKSSRTTPNQKPKTLAAAAKPTRPQACPPSSGSPCLPRIPRSLCARRAARRSSPEFRLSPFRPPQPSAPADRGPASCRLTPQSRSPASGRYPSAFGWCVPASGRYPSAFGWCVPASGRYPSTFGWCVSAFGRYPSAIGRCVSAIGRSPSASEERPPTAQKGAFPPKIGIPEPQTNSTKRTRYDQN